MASPDVMTALSAVTSSSAAQGDKISQFTSILNTITTNSSTSPPTQLTADLNAFIDCLLQDSVGIIVSRPVLSDLVTALKSLPVTSPTRQDTALYLLDALQPRILSFEEQDSNTRLLLADIYESNNDNSEAAKVLIGISLDSAQRIIPDLFKLNIYIRIMRNLLEDQETVTAERYLNRATSLIYLSTDPLENLHFSMAQARIFDAKRDFLNACSKYLQLSFSPSVEESDKISCLNAAITCAVLAPAGPARSRSLATLYKDDRVPTVEHFPILEKMYFDRLLSPSDVEAFSKTLQPHQLARNSDGTTVLSRAVVEHNLLGASRLYNNIGVAELGVLLNLQEDQAEEYAARMIEQKRLAGSIDQIDKLIYFDGPPGGGQLGDVIVGRQTKKWDANILGLAEEVERVTTLLQNECPEFVSEHMASRGGALTV